MNIVLNGKEHETSARSVAELTKELALPEKGVALAMENAMVPRAAWETTMLKEGAKVLVIRAACGG